MKIRLSFVTNSSSSSFVVAYRSTPQFDEETLVKYPFLKKYGNLLEQVLLIKGDYGYETTEGDILHTKQEFDEWFVDNYGWREMNTVEKIIENDEYVRKRYNNLLKYISDGFSILAKRVDYSDEYCNNLIYSLAADNDDFIILEDD